jgi:hypothetical protein
MSLLYSEGDKKCPVIRIGIVTVITAMEAVAELPAAMMSASGSGAVAA